jgi:hypothetical protein
MQKLFELTSQDWMKGIAISSHYPSTGIFANAAGINPFLDPYSRSSQFGLLQAPAAPVDATGGIVVDDIWGGVLLNSDYKAYLIGNGGNFYEVNTVNATPTNLRSGANVIASPAEGVAIYQVAGGTKYLYYAMESQIGRWDLSGSYPTGWDDTYIGSGMNVSVAMETTSIRNFHHFVGNLYFTNKNYVGGIIDNGSGLDTNAFSQLLDLPSTLTIVDLDDDGYYLVVAATENKVAGNTQHNTLNKIYFWDTASNSWQREWTIDTPSISGIKKIGGMMYALCTDGVYAFSFSTPPTLLIPLTASDGPLVGGVSPTSHTIAVEDSVLYWGMTGTGGVADVAAYGSPVPGMSPRFYKPYKGINNNGSYSTSYLASIGKYQMFIAGNDKFGTLSNVSYGNTGVSAETIYIPLGSKYDIKRIEVILGEPLASGDSLNIDLQSDEDTSASDWGTMSYALHGAVRSKMLPGAFKVESLKLILNFNGGNPKIKKIAVYGDSVTI